MINLSSSNQNMSSTKCANGGSNLDNLSAMKCSLNDIGTSNISLVSSRPNSLLSIDTNINNIFPNELISSKKRKLKGWGSYESRKSYNCLKSLDRKKVSMENSREHLVSVESRSLIVEDDSWGFFIDDSIFETS